MAEYFNFETAKNVLTLVEAGMAAWALKQSATQHTTDVKQSREYHREGLEQDIRFEKYSHRQRMIEHKFQIYYTKIKLTMHETLRSVEALDIWLQKWRHINNDIQQLFNQWATINALLIAAVTGVAWEMGINTLNEETHGDDIKSWRGMYVFLTICIVGISTTSLAICLTVSTRLFMKEMRFTALKNKHLGKSYGYVQRAGTLITLGMTVSYVSLIWLLAMRLSLNQSTRLFSQTPFMIIMTAILSSAVAFYYLVENTCRVTCGRSSGNKTWVFIGALTLTEQKYIGECIRANKLLNRAGRNAELEFGTLLAEFRAFLSDGLELSIIDKTMISSTTSTMHNEFEVIMTELKQHESHLRNYTNQYTNTVEKIVIGSWKCEDYKLCEMTPWLWDATRKAWNVLIGCFTTICCPNHTLHEQEQHNVVEKTRLMDDILF